MKKKPRGSGDKKKRPTDRLKGWVIDENMKKRTLADTAILRFTEELLSKRDVRVGIWLRPRTRKDMPPKGELLKIEYPDGSYLACYYTVQNKGFDKNGYDGRVYMRMKMENGKPSQFDYHVIEGHGDIWSCLWRDDNDSREIRHALLVDLEALRLYVKRLGKGVVFSKHFKTPFDKNDGGIFFPHQLQQTYGPGTGEDLPLLVFACSYEPRTLLSAL